MPKLPSDRRLITGAALVLLGAVLFSTKAVIVKLAYRYEVDSISLLALRMLFSLPFFLLVASYSGKASNRRHARLSHRDRWSILILGVMGYYLASLLDFLGLQYITAGLERLILFVYPTLVLLIGALVFREPVYRRQLGALVLTYVGITIAFLEGLSLSGGKNFVLGTVMVFFGALAYAVYIVGSGRLLPRIGTLRFTSLAMTAAAAAVLIHHGIARQWHLFGFPAPVYGLAFLMALIATVLPSFILSEGIRIIGSGNASIVGSIGPVSTIVLAYIFLGEQLGWMQWSGTILVISGVLFITLQKHRKPRLKPE
ncbi:MAG: DMT family transporter [Phaeodactylibacter sp.]|nr:DMT family transporter [Phaeodactylibacter sp.]MCB9285909.1 DMT family transporter [Lewinellaceae bacterium]